MYLNEFIQLYYLTLIIMLSKELPFFCLFLFTDLPPQSNFYNELTNETLSDEDYSHVQEIWSEFEMECLGDLHDL